MIKNIFAHDHTGLQGQLPMDRSHKKWIFYVCFLNSWKGWVHVSLSCMGTSQIDIISSCPLCLGCQYGHIADIYFIKYVSKLSLAGQKSHKVAPKK
jgi:hypothetical protein